MWPLKLIIGVAVAASSLMTFTGIVLAITIERQRFHKYIKRHTAGRTVDNEHDTEQTIDRCNCSAHMQENLQLPALRKSSETWLTVPQGGTPEPKRSSDASTVTIEEKPATKKSLHKTLHGPIKKKKRGNRKRLKRAPTHGRHMIPSLAAISEHSDGSQVSVETIAPVEGKITTKKSWESNNSRSKLLPSSVSTSSEVTTAAMIAESKGKTRSELSEGSPISLSTAIAGSRAPEDPLPSLPIVQFPEKRLSQRPGSITSVESVSSSVLDPYSPPTRRSARTHQKNLSKVLRAFEFDFPLIQRRRSPLHQMMSLKEEEGEEGSPATTVDPTLISKSKDRPVVNTTASDRFNKIITITDQARVPSKRPAGRHSMSDNANMLKDWRKGVISSLCHGESDPFVTNPPSRPFSLIERIPLRELEPATRTQRVISYHSELDNARPQNNNMKPVQWPVLAPIPKNVLQHQSLDPEKTSPVQDTSEQDVARRTARSTVSETSTGSPRPRRNGSDRCSSAIGRSRPGLDTSRCPSPKTPLSATIQKWRFDFLPPDTPTLFPPPTPERSYNSPVLPSPAYSSKELYLKPRRSQVRGPRSPPGSRTQSRSPLRKHSSNLHAVKPSSMTRAERYESSTDLRKSVILLRSLNSESRLLSSEQDLAYHRLGSVSRDSPPSSIPVLSKHKSKTKLSSTTLAKSPITAKPSMASLQSSGSDSGVSSIWEDASVHDDVPELESRVLSPVQTTQKPVIETSRVGKDTPQATVGDFEANENFTRDGEQMGHLKHAESVRRQSNAPGVRGSLIKVTIPGTPGSMYDASGFLKE